MEWDEEKKGKKEKRENSANGFGHWSAPPTNEKRDDSIAHGCHGNSFKVPNFGVDDITMRQTLPFTRFYWVLLGFI